MSVKSWAFRGLLALALGACSLFVVSAPAASADVTWSQVSPYDLTYDGSDPNSQYDLTFSSAYIFDNDPDLIYFYLEFAEVPTVDMFNDGLNSFAFIGLDYDFDGETDVRLEVTNKTLTTDRSSVKGVAYDYNSKRDLPCETSIFTNIDEDAKWVGIKVSRSCINLPDIFDMSGYAEYNDLGGGDSFDWAPVPFFRVELPNSTSNSTDSTSVNSDSGATYDLPTNIANASTKALNFSEPPKDLSQLSEQLLPSVVTVSCGNGTGTGWSAVAKLPSSLTDLGYKSLVVTNNHVIADCLTDRKVTLTLSDSSEVDGEVISWNDSNDVAGIVTDAKIPGLQWIGTRPKQGWWVGVLGSPLGKANILTTGILSSINTLAQTFTLTAPINPGNSGGPVFDSTGRVLGLATSKNLLSSGQLAEGFGNAQGVPLLCSVVIECEVENDPWNAVSKFEISSTSNADAKAKADAAAKAAAEAKAKADAEAKAAAEAKAKADAEAKLRDDFTKKCLSFNGDVELEIFNAKNAKSLYPSSAKLIQSLLSNPPTEFDCTHLDITTFETELSIRETFLSSFQTTLKSTISKAKADASKKKTITCVKGKLIKKITAVSPKCPTGYKKK